MDAYRTQSKDTDPSVERLIVQHLRALTPQQKIAMIRRACRAAETWTRAGLRQRYPDADEHELRRRAGALRLGAEIVREVYGWEPEENAR